MSTERKTELGRDLQRRADVCHALAGEWDHLAPVPGRDQTIGNYARLRCVAKAEAYAHAAELADAAAEGSK